MFSDDIESPNNIDVTVDESVNKVDSGDEFNPLNTSESKDLKYSNALPLDGNTPVFVDGAIVFEFNKEDTALLVGKSGRTKNKICSASGASLNVHTEDEKGYVEIRGTAEQQERAYIYVHAVRAIKTSNFRFPLFDENDKPIRNDMTFVDVPCDCIGYVTGTGGKSLRNTEEENNALMIFLSQLTGKKKTECDKLIIFGKLRNRIGAELQVLSAIERKKEKWVSANYTTDIDDEYKDLRVDKEHIPPEVFSLHREAMSKRKIALASNCIVQYIGEFVCFVGTLTERKRGREYFHLYINQKSPIHIENINDRNDIIEVKAPAFVIHELFLNKRHDIRRIEEDTRTLILVNPKKGSTISDTIVILSVNDKDRMRSEKLMYSLIDRETRGHSNRTQSPLRRSVKRDYNKNNNPNRSRSRSRDRERDHQKTYKNDLRFDSKSNNDLRYESRNKYSIDNKYNDNKFDKYDHKDNKNDNNRFNKYHDNKFDNKFDNKYNDNKYNDNKYVTDIKYDQYRSYDTNLTSAPINNSSGNPLNPNMNNNYYNIYDNRNDKHNYNDNYINNNMNMNPMPNLPMNPNINPNINNPNMNSNMNSNMPMNPNMNPVNNNMNYNYHSYGRREDKFEESNNRYQSNNQSNPNYRNRYEQNDNMINSYNYDSRPDTHNINTNQLNNNPNSINAHPHHSNQNTNTRYNNQNNNIRYERGNNFNNMNQNNTRYNNNDYSNYQQGPAMNYNNQNYNYKNNNYQEQRVNDYKPKTDNRNFEQFNRYENPQHLEQNNTSSVVYGYQDSNRRQNVEPKNQYQVNMNPPASGFIRTYKNEF